MILKKDATTIVKGIIVTLLLLCLIDADYGYYQAMRSFISFGFAFLAFTYYKSGDQTNAIIFLCLLILFQPLLRIGLGRGLWIVLDLFVAGYLIYQILKASLEFHSTKTGQRRPFKNNSSANEISISDKVDGIRKKW